MTRAVHNVLNRFIPSPVRDMLRRSALLTIPSMRHLDMGCRLANLAAQGLRPRVIHDIGAASGDWARMAARVWPDARIVGFEPNVREKESLDRTKRELLAFEYHMCFLGARSCDVEYTDKGTQTSALASRESPGSTSAPMRVLDELVEAQSVPRPDFLKLDVQGYELEVLKGGERSIEGSQAMLLEVTFIPFLDGMPLAADVVQFLERRGFLWSDVMGIFRRPQDDALMQMDVLFLRSGHPLRRSGLT